MKVPDRKCRQSPNGECKHTTLGKEWSSTGGLWGAVKGLELGEPRFYLCFKKTTLPVGLEVLKGDKA